MLRTLLWRLCAWDVALSYALALPDTPNNVRARHRARLVAHLGDSALWLPLAAFVHWRARQRCSRYAPPAAGWLASLLLTAGAVLALKSCLRRPRPQPPARFDAAPGPDQHSFPSGHAALLAASAVWLGAFVPLGGAGGVLLALAVGLSRVRLGIHYVGDLVAGYLLGGVLALAVRSSLHCPARAGK